MNEQDEALKQFKEIHEDKIATINCRDYVLTAFSHAQRLKVFAFFTHVQADLARGDFWFLQGKEWSDVQKVIENAVTYDGVLLSKRRDHWDEFPEDFILFIGAMLGAISYPFLRGVRGG
ncbi:hypothetical protein [Marinobacter sp.]|uniref:hypothetical protein n=1 Tax=Marinobacter sp. TaxID=50741 RepID=UPI000C920D60|nr:hypothetical protein [Marinobacter sp.]MAB53535.1 hypothetical protein [Marinobacter sp.]|tara:strand:+ start:376 stop:732 length:357 start_codon:yes stop_codon:yes gene_type:complete